MELKGGWKILVVLCNVYLLFGSFEIAAVGVVQAGMTWQHPKHCTARSRHTAEVSKMSDRLSKHNSVIHILNCPVGLQCRNGV